MKHNNDLSKHKTQTFAEGDGEIPPYEVYNKEELSEFHPDVTEYQHVATTFGDGVAEITVHNQ